METATERSLGKGYALTESVLHGIFRPLLKTRKQISSQADILTLPNVISLLRIPLGLLVFLTIADPRWWIPLSLLLAGVVSDHIDGTLARLTGSTRLGAILDPICDKIFFFFCLVSLRPKFEPAAFAVILALESFILLAPPIAIRFRRTVPSQTDLRSNIYGKYKFFLECVAVLAAFLEFRNAATSMLYLASIMAVLSIYKKIKDSI